MIVTPGTGRAPHYSALKPGTALKSRAVFNIRGEPNKRAELVASSSWQVRPGALAVDAPEHPAGRDLWRLDARC
ncbi:MAG: hypothetical protein JWL84_12 [Rhodospirillales bacterium]|nr:hypothetical protein [Rhodospirillales bacterium]